MITEQEKQELKEKIKKTNRKIYIYLAIFSVSLIMGGIFLAIYLDSNDKPQYSLGSDSIVDVTEYNTFSIQNTITNDTNKTMSLISIHYTLKDKEKDIVIGTGLATISNLAKGDTAVYKAIGTISYNPGKVIYYVDKVNIIF